MEDFFDQFDCEENNEYSITIDDNGEVAYAYLLQNGNIIGDVWLYNRLKNPDVVNWQDKDNMPFANPKMYLKNDTIISPVSSSKDIKIIWDFGMNSSLSATIYIKGQAIAILDSESNPGRSFLVKKDGPLAKAI